MLLRGCSQRQRQRTAALRCRRWTHSRARWTTRRCRAQSSSFTVPSTPSPRGTNYYLDSSRRIQRHSYLSRCTRGRPLPEVVPGDPYPGVFYAQCLCGSKAFKLGAVTMSQLLQMHRVVRVFFIHLIEDFTQQFASINKSKKKIYNYVTSKLLHYCAWKPKFSLATFNSAARKQRVHITSIQTTSNYDIVQGKHAGASRPEIPQSSLFIHVEISAMSMRSLRDEVYPSVKGIELLAKYAFIRFYSAPD